MADVHLICDNLAKSEKLNAALSSNFWVEISLVDKQSGTPIATDCVVVIDCDLANKTSVAALKASIAAFLHPERSIFLVDGSDFAGRIRSNALGGGLVMNRAAGTSSLIREIENILRDLRPTPDTGAPADVSRVLEQARRLQQDIAVAVHDDEALPKEAIATIADNLVDILATHGIDTWIDTVRHYHSHTYRHCMMVTGYAVAFGQQLELAAGDIDLLAVSALLHDVGKVHIPLSILDKPGKLTREEFDEIKQHPEYSREILVADGQFDPAIVDAATHHHEYIDGSGYPDGLGGDEIRPLVRMLTIADIYAALIEKRSYKRAFSNRESFQIMSEMGDKLDTRLLGAFRPMVLDETFGRVRKSAPVDPARKQPVLKSSGHPLGHEQPSAVRPIRAVGFGNSA